MLKGLLPTILKIDFSGSNIRHLQASNLHEHQPNLRVLIMDGTKYKVDTHLLPIASAFGNLTYISMRRLEMQDCYEEALDGAPQLHQLDLSGAKSSLYASCFRFLQNLPIKWLSQAGNRYLKVYLLVFTVCLQLYNRRYNRHAWLCKQCRVFGHFRD